MSERIRRWYRTAAIFAELVYLLLVFTFILYPLHCIVKGLRYLGGLRD